MAQEKLQTKVPHNHRSAFVAPTWALVLIRRRPEVEVRIMHNRSLGPDVFPVIVTAVLALQDKERKLSLSFLERSNMAPIK